MTENKPKRHIHVTAGLIWKGDRLLITRRPEGSHLAGLWEFPGGKQEEGESLQDCLEREIREELDLKVKAGKLFITVQHEYDTKIVTLHIFNCASMEGSPRAMEGQEIKWVDPSNLRDHSFPPPDQLIIKGLEEKKLYLGKTSGVVS